MNILIKIPFFAFRFCQINEELKIIRMMWKIVSTLKLRCQHIMNSTISQTLQFYIILELCLCDARLNQE